jgi:NAD(P)-dependent dehydrogenase (short-subunit alcohol dehydrogenase family)
MLQFDLAGFKALVIGAAGGVGLAIARRLATSKWKHFLMPLTNDVIAGPSP